MSTCFCFSVFLLTTIFYLLIFIAVLMMVLIGVYFLMDFITPALLVFTLFLPRILLITALIMDFMEDFMILVILMG